MEADLLQWQEWIIGELSLKACRKDIGPDDLACPLALYLERSRQGRKQVHGASYDLTKAFDTLSFEVEEREGGGYQGEGLGWKILEKWASQ